MFKLLTILTTIVGSIGLSYGQMPFQKPEGTFNITNEISVDYLLTFEGKTTNNNNNYPYLKFSTLNQNSLLIPMKI